MRGAWIPYSHWVPPSMDFRIVYRLDRGSWPTHQSVTADILGIILDRESCEFLCTWLFSLILLVSIFCHNSVNPFLWRQGKWFPVFKGIESNGWYYWWQMTMWHNFCGGHRNFAKWKPLAKVLSWLTNQWLIPSFFLPSTDIVLCLPTFVWYLPSYLCHILSNAMIYCCRPHLHGRKDKATMGSLQSMTFYSFT